MSFKINTIETSSFDCPAFLKDSLSNNLFPNVWAIGNLQKHGLKP